MIFRAFVIAAAMLFAREANATQCRKITRGTYIETLHPNGAVSTGTVNEGTIFFVVACAPEGTLVWCTVQETRRPVFTIRRYLETDRLDAVHSEEIDFSRCVTSSE